MNSLNLKQQLLVDFPKDPFDGLMEEAAEVIQSICKLKRFGPDSRHPDGGPTNLQSLFTELYDLEKSIEIVQKHLAEKY